MQSYNRDLFIFLYFLLIIVSAMTSFTIHNEKSPLTGKSILYLNRHQTEEWKGWMQVMYLYSFIMNACLLGIRSWMLLVLFVLLYVGLCMMNKIVGYAILLEVLLTSKIENLYQ